MKLNRRNVKRGRIEVIPMIDTILILLIFFMSFSTFDAKEKRIDAKMPVTTTKPPVAESKVPLDIVLHVLDAKQIVVNGGNSMALDDLKAVMAEFGLINQEATVVIEAEPATKYADVIGALDACALANFTKVAFRPLAATPAPAPK